MKKKNNDTIKLLPIIVFSFVIGGIITLSILRWTPILDQVIGNRNTVITKNGTQVYEGTVPYNAEAGTYDESGFSLRGSDINTTAELAGKGASKNYRLFVWLNEAGENNNVEQGAIFKGTIHVDLPGSNGNITGVAVGE